MNHGLGFACNVDYHANCMSAKDQSANFRHVIELIWTQQSYN